MISAMKKNRARLEHREGEWGAATSHRVTRENPKRTRVQGLQTPLGGVFQNEQAGGAKVC